MEVSNTVLKLIVERCCRKLSYNDEERQFSFPLCPSLTRVWEEIRPKIREIHPHFLLHDFNEILFRLEDAVDSCDVLSFSFLEDKNLANGEVLCLEIASSDLPLRLIRMRSGQYLDISAGVGLVLGDKFEFRVGKSIVTSEGDDRGVCKSIAIMIPTIYNIVLDSVFIRKYYLNDINDTLWPIYDEAVGYIQCRDSQRLENIVNIAGASGVGSFPLLNILKSVCALK